MKGSFKSSFALLVSPLVLTFLIPTNCGAQEEKQQRGIRCETGAQNAGYARGSEMWFAVPADSALGYQEEDKIALRLAALAKEHEEDPLLMVLLAQHLVSSGDDTSAIVWLRRVVESLGDNSATFPVNVQYLLGTILGRCKDFNGASVALEAARRSYLYPGNAAEIDGELASSYAAAGRLEDALTAITMAIQDSPGDRRSWLLYMALKRDSKPSGTDSTGIVGHLPDAERTLSLGYMGNWASASFMENSDVYLQIADNLTQQGNTNSAQNYRKIVSEVALVNAQKAVFVAKYDEALALFSLADRAVELSSLKRSDQDNLLPFITTAYLNQGRTLAALKIASSFKQTSPEVLYSQYTAIIQNALARISWNLNTHERTLDDPMGFADLFEAKQRECAISARCVFSSGASGAESQAVNSLRENRPADQLRELWRSDFRYGMTNTDEDLATLFDAIGHPSLLGPEIDLLLAQRKPELPAKVFLGELAEMIGLGGLRIAHDPRTNPGGIQFRTMTPERLEQLNKLIRSAKPDDIRPETVEAVAVGESLLRVLSAGQ